MAGYKGNVVGSAGDYEIESVWESKKAMAFDAMQCVWVCKGSLRL